MIKYEVSNQGYFIGMGWVSGLIRISKLQMV